MEVQLRVKVELAQRGRKLRQLADSLGWEYGKLSRVVNGYAWPPADFDQLVRDVLARWDAEQTPERAA